MPENAKKLACEVRKTNYRSEENNKKSRHNNGRWWKKNDKKWKDVDERKWKIIDWKIQNDKTGGEILWRTGKKTMENSCKTTVQLRKTGRCCDPDGWNPKKSRFWD